MLGYMSATNTGQVMAAHNRIAQAAKSALREAGGPDQRIYEKLQGIMNEMGGGRAPEHTPQFHTYI